MLWFLLWYSADSHDCSKTQQSHVTQLWRMQFFDTSLQIWRGTLFSAFDRHNTSRDRFRSVPLCHSCLRQEQKASANPTSTLPFSRCAVSSNTHISLPKEYTHFPDKKLPKFIIVREILLGLYAFFSISLQTQNNRFLSSFFRWFSCFFEEVIHTLVPID